MTPTFLRVPHPRVSTRGVLTRGVRSAVAAVVLMSVLAACSSEKPSGDPSGAPSAPSESSGEGPDGTDGSQVEAAQPGERATAYPVPADVQAEPLPDLGTVASGEWSMTLNGLTRSGEQGALLTATLTPVTATAFDGLAEPGYANIENAEGRLERTREFSAVTLTVDGDPAIYQVMRDESGACACYQGSFELTPEVPIGVYAYVTVPADATTVDVTVAGIGTVEGVEVQG